MSNKVLPIHTLFMGLFNKSIISKIRVAYNDLYRKCVHVSRRSSAREMFVKVISLTLNCYFEKKPFHLLLE